MKMAGVASEDCGVGRYAEGISSGQHCQTGEALAEWQSSEQVENGTPSTSLLYWDSDDGNDGGMPLDPFHVWLSALCSFKIVCYAVCLLTTITKSIRALG